MKTIRLRLLEFGKLVNDIHGDVKPYDVMREIKSIIIDTANIDGHSVDHKRRLLSNINSWLQDNGLDLGGAELVDIVDNYLVLHIPNNYGTQVDMFGKDSILPMLQNAGLR